MNVSAVPLDWYRNSFATNYHSLYWEEGGEEKAAMALAMLEPRGGERILELACASGRRTLELSRRGFGVVGVDPLDSLLEVAAGDAENRDLWPFFINKDPRELDLEPEFHIVLSLGGGAFDHFESDEENLRAFRAAARAMRRDGRLLMQIPNVIHVERHLPKRVRLCGGEAIDLIHQRWDAKDRCLCGTRVTYLEEDPEMIPEGESFRRRLYSLDELAELFQSIGLYLSDVFDRYGGRCVPTDEQQELFVEARK